MSVRYSSKSSNTSMVFSRTAMGCVTVLAVSMDVDDSAYRHFVRDHRVSLLTIHDPDQKSNALYGSFKFPETYIIDRNGVMRRKFIGAVDWTTPEITDFLSKL